MKITGRRALLVPLLSIGVMVGGCDDSITDFGFNGHVSGVVVDPAGNPVSGNVATTDLRVFVLGEGELEPLEIRVKPDGTYQNTHLFPQVYDLWIEGPVVTPLSRDNPETVDLTGAPVTHNLTVTPFLSIATPVVTQPSGTSVEVTYDITPTGADAVDNAVVWVSTASWPGPTTGSVVPDLRTHTAQANLTGSSGTVTVDGLRADSEYHVRIGARATGSVLWNYSDQVVITTGN